MGNLRLTFRLAALALTLALHLALHGLWRLFRLPSPWPRRFLRHFGRIAGARARVSGTPLARNVVFLANHLSWIDIPVLAGATGTAFVAKSELADHPLVGFLCRLNHTLFVRRGDRMGIAEQVATIRAALDSGWAVTIFPEGTTGDGATLLPFKAALLAVLEPPPPGLMVQPVRIDYGAATPKLAWIGDEPGTSHGARVFRRRGAFPVNLHFLEPFAPADFPGRKAIAAEARRRIEATLP
ncbi:lysophospholipid acyltransferase family protein [Sphingomonas sp.]|jgi:1-acyl-sn-glycerol-3-phosphate acyltransferase|uniref:lysophospholipid acyltransferase family protein n=1 Tax=Sphingomonas sp. TaxID=28214 RepID=UPI002D80DFF2|nr:lysophospholipid acyltransferase family protein [Sphingomonas sp.]HEU0043012.1 lysophospholipid acyltransferase family protein [Sphingomonas sp.]